MHALSSESIANYFIQKSFEEGVNLTQMKLLKLVYIAHGWHLGYFDQPLISDAVQAWQYGPVIPKLYRKISKYGRRTIDALIEGYGVICDGQQENTPPHESTIPLLNKVWETYSGLSGIQLSTMTHQNDTPWHYAWIEAKGSPYSGTIISNELIRQHYKRKVNGS